MTEEIVREVSAALSAQPSGAVLTTRELVAAMGREGEEARLLAHKLFSQGASVRLAAADLFRQSEPFTRYGKTTRRRFWSIAWASPEYDRARIAEAQLRQTRDAGRGKSKRLAKADGALETRMDRLEAQVTLLASQLERTLDVLTKA